MRSRSQASIRYDEFFRDVSPTCVFDCSANRRGVQMSAPEVRGAALRAGDALEPGPRRSVAGRVCRSATASTTGGAPQRVAIHRESSRGRL